MPTALITGFTRQGGSYLAEFLLSKGYKIVGMSRRTSTLNFERISRFQDAITLIQGDSVESGAYFYISVFTK